MNNQATRHDFDTSDPGFRKDQESEYVIVNNQATRHDFEPTYSERVSGPFNELSGVYSTNNAVIGLPNGNLIQPHTELPVSYRRLVFDNNGRVPIQGGSGISFKKDSNNYASFRKVLFVNGGSMMTEVAINGRPVNALIDHGAQRTLISHSLWNSLENKPKMSTENNVNGLIDGQPSIKVFECESIDLLFGKKHYDWKPLVGPFKEEVVIGLDFMLTFDVGLDMNAKILTLDDKEIPFFIEGVKVLKKQM